MKKGTLLNPIIAIIITVIVLGLAVPNALHGIAGVVAYGEPENIFFLLPTLVAGIVIYTIWLLVRRYPRMFREYVLFFGLILGLLIFYLSTLAPCSGTQLCLGLEPLVALGIFLLTIFLLSLYYFARVRLIDKDSKRRTTK